MTSTEGNDPPRDGLTDDRILGGRVALWQPAEGYRVGLDAVLLAAATPARPGETVLDLGTGVGGVFLCLAARIDDLHTAAVELQADYAALAHANARRNSVEAAIVEADVAALPASLRQRQFHHVVCNPPYFDRSLGSASPNSGRDIAFGGDTPIEVWIDAAARRLRPKGQFTLIQRIERLPEVLTTLGGRLGSTQVLPLAAREGRAADRFILSARKDGKAPFRMLAPMILHDGPAHLRDAEDYSRQVRAILRDAAPLPLGD